MDTRERGTLCTSRWGSLGQPMWLPVLAFNWLLTHHPARTLILSVGSPSAWLWRFDVRRITFAIARLVWRAFMDILISCTRFALQAALMQVLKRTLGGVVR